MDDENIKNKNIVKSNFKLNEVIIIILITVAIGIIIGYCITNKNNYLKNGDDKALNEFVNTYEDIVKKYYEDIDKNKLINSAIDGMLANLDDPYSSYMDEDTTKDFNEKLYGDYTGIGAEITMDESGNVIIYNPFEGSPAKEAGLLYGDIIIKIDNKDVKGKNSSEISKLIKGHADTTVKITVLRDGKEKEFSITRRTIVLDSVVSEIIENDNKKIGYIYISIFAANTYTQFVNSINELEKENIDSLIIDVRNNSGGYLDIVSEMIELFLKKGDIIYQLKDQDNTKLIKDNTKEHKEYNVSVLINGYSASASEILASALQESYGAMVIGTNSYGKGTVQQTKELLTGGMLKYTTQKWLTPKGNWINEVGVTPDEIVELNEEYYNNPSKENDNQLQKALNMLKK